MSIDAVGSGGMIPFGADTGSAKAETTTGNGGTTPAPAQAPTDGQAFGAQVVAKTLDTMNSGDNADYGFQKDVLNAAMFDKGGVKSTEI